MTESVSKQKRAYYRKLYLAHLIDSARQDQLSLEAATGMPRRTLQDAIRAMVDIGIDCEFVQDGAKHRHGYYRIANWGDHDRNWIAANIHSIESLLA